MARAVQVFKDNAVALKESEAQTEVQRRAAEEERYATKRCVRRPRVRCNGS